MSGRDLAAEIVVARSDSFRLEVALSIPAGTTAALLGPNGAGKSTAVAALAGLLPLDSGRIALGETVLDDPDGRVFVPAEGRNVGVVFQDFLLFPHLSVIDNVTFGLRSRGVSRDEAAKRALSWLDRVGLHGLERHRPGDLSGGQAQRVALARALVTEPDLLLLDEPLAALDVSTRTDLRHTLGEHLEAFDGPRVLITHDPTEAFLLADDIHVIEHGALTQSGSADQIRLRPQTAYVADLVGFNLVRGVARGGLVDTGTQALHVVDDADGPVLVTIHPTAISVHSSRPGGSPRNSWPTTVQRLERLGNRVRLRTGAPLPLTVEVTEASRVELGLVPGSEIWVAVKATELHVAPEGSDAAPR